VLVDFHSHTRESDGTLEPRELAALMRRRGVCVYSVTDHDTLAAYGDSGLEDGTGSPRLVVGIEINTTYRGSEVHLLGYGLPLGAAELNDTLATNRRARVERVAKIVGRLNAIGVDVSFDDVRAQANGGASLGRPHVAMALVRAGYVRTIDAAFRSLLGRDRPGYEPSVHLTPHRAIEIIVRAGGVPVLAHPGRLRDYDLIDEMADAGVAGIEVFYPSHDQSQVALFRERARDLGLVMTAGSDFHDARYNVRGVGVEVEPGDIAPFLELVG
jgi:predicted metal-dependent phosphoesterase TrpH